MPTVRSRRVSVLGVLAILIGVLGLATAPCLLVAGIFITCLKGLLGIRGLGPYPPLSDEEKLGALVEGLAILFAGFAVLIVGVLFLRTGIAVLGRRPSGLIWAPRLVVLSLVATFAGFVALVVLADAMSTPWHLLPWDQSDREVLLLFGSPLMLVLGGVQFWIWRIFHDHRITMEFADNSP